MHCNAAGLALAIGVACATPATLAAQDSADLFEAMRVTDMIGIMRLEGLEHGQELARDLTGSEPSAEWRDTLSDIYDETRMASAVRARFEAALDDAQVLPLLDFFASETGGQIVELELGARRAMIDDALEEEAIAAYTAAAEPPRDPRLDQIDRLIEAGDLIEMNVSGALNASFHFYRGLSDGGYLDMTEAEMLDDVRRQEDETRADTTEWVYSFMLLAYSPLSEEARAQYAALAESEPGRALNAALFEAFNAMYDDISYALGLAAARELQATEL